MKRQLRYGGLVTALAVPFMLRGQEKPLTASGTFSTGYYSASTRGDANQSTSFVPVGASFEVDGYAVSRDFLRFSAQPELQLGPQASDAGFQGGNGIRLGITLLGKSIAPLTFRYSNVQLEDVYFGSLSQFSGYTLKDRNKDLGLAWEFKPHGFPQTTVDWGRGSVDSKSSTAGISDYQSHGDHLNVDSRYEQRGWDLQGFMHRSAQESDLLSAAAGGTQVGSITQKVIQYQGSARRSFLGDSEVYVEGGSQSTSSLLFNFPIDLGTHYVSANVRLAQKKRLKTMLRAGYSSNLASQFLSQAASSLAGPGTAVPDQNVLVPFSHGIANFNLNGTTSFAVGHGFALYDTVERNALYASGANGPLNSDYFTTTGGVTYAGRFHWANVSGDYAREYGLGSLIGESGSIQGQNYSFTAQHGTSGGLEYDGTVRGVNQSIKTAQPLTNASVSVEGSVAGRVAGEFSVRLGGGWQWSSLANFANEFRTNGYTARAGIEHPRFQVTAALNNAISNSLPLYNQLLDGLGLESVMVTALQAIPSDFRAMSFTLHANPLRKIELSASWTHSTQHLDGLLTNNFELLNAYITYHFRKIQLESGFIRSNQVFSFFPNTLRSRFYLRVVRRMKLL